MLQTGSKRQFDNGQSTSSVERETVAGAHHVSTQPIENDELECEICTDEYKDPKLLHCMHTFCGGCIEQLQNHGNEKNLKCPKCRFVTKVGDDGNLHLLRNHIIEQKVKRHQASLSRNKKTLQCSDCDSENATDLCTTCQLKLCNFCAAYHKRSVRFKDHEVRSIENASNEELLDKQPMFNVPMIRCSMHKQEVKYYCETCKVSICVDCMICKLHQGHVFNSIAQAMEEGCGSLKKLITDAAVISREYEGYLGKVNAFQRKSIEDGDASRRLVEDTFAEMSRVLQSEKQKLLDWLTEKNDSSADSVKNAKENANHLKNMTNYMKEVLEYQAADVVDLVSGLARLHDTYSLHCMENVTKDRADVLSNPIYSPVATTDATSGETNDFDVQLVARKIERSVPLTAFKSHLKKLRDNFNLQESRFPSPAGVCSLTIKNVSQLPDQVLGEHITYWNCLWRLKVKQYNVRNVGGALVSWLGVIVKCEPMEYTSSWRCSAHGMLTLKSHNGDDYTREFPKHDYCYEQSSKRIYLFPWESVTDESAGYIKDDSITIKVHILVDE